MMLNYQRSDEVRAKICRGSRLREESRSHFGPKHIDHQSYRPNLELYRLGELLEIADQWYHRIATQAP
jgi:hypothetical protein